MPVEFKPIQVVSVLHYGDRYRLQITTDAEGMESAGPYYLFDQDVCEDALNHIAALANDNVKVTAVYTSYGPIVIYHFWKLEGDRRAIDEAIYQLIATCAGCLPRSSHLTMQSFVLRAERDDQDQPGEKGE